MDLISLLSKLGEFKGLFDGQCRIARNVMGIA